MKLLILAGGYAKRLWPLTHEIPKPLLPVAGRPVIEYIIEKAERTSEIDEIFISTNRKFAGNFNKWLEGFSCPKKIKLIVEPTLSENEKFGSIRGIRHVIDTEKIREDLMEVSGDNLFNVELSDVVKFYKERGNAIVGFFDMKDPERVRRKYGIVILDSDGNVKDFEEKPENPKSTLVSTGIYVFPKDTFRLLFNYLDNGGSPDQPGHFIDWLSKRVTISGFVFSEEWFDIGCMDEYKRAQRSFECRN